MADLNHELIYIRVLEHDTCDQIRIGQSYPIYKHNLDEHVEKVKKAYAERMDWCGGWTDENNNKYHERIAIVDADSLQTLKVIWKKKH